MGEIKKIWGEIKAILGEIKAILGEIKAVLGLNRRRCFFTGGGASPRSRDAARAPS